MRLHLVTKLILFIVSLVLVTGCDTISGIGKDNHEKLHELASYHPTIIPERIWYENTHAYVNREGLRLNLVAQGQRLYTASTKGKIIGINNQSGQIIWQNTIKENITSGPAVGGNRVYITIEEGKIYAYSANNGVLLWKKKLPDESLSTPYADDEVVLVKTLDGVLLALSPTNGQTLWTYHNNVPHFILRDESAPQVNNGIAVAGFANGQCVALDVKTGRVKWKKSVALPGGFTEVSRMVDIDANPIIEGNIVYVATFQGQVAAVDLQTGHFLWKHPMSSFESMAVGPENIYVSDTKSHVWALDKYSGMVTWRQTRLQARDITGPVFMDNKVIVGDGQGYLHWMNANDGHFEGRTRMDNSGIKDQPIVSKHRLYAIARSGRLAAYKMHTVTNTR